MTAWGRLDSSSGTGLVVHDLVWHSTSAEFALRSSAALTASSTAPSARLEAAVLGHQTDQSKLIEHSHATGFREDPVWRPPSES